MRTLVRRPVGLGNYVPEGACFQTEGEKTCSRLKQRLHSAVLERRMLLSRLLASMALDLKRGPVTSRPSLHFLVVTASASPGARLLSLDLVQALR